MAVRGIEMKVTGVHHNARTREVAETRFGPHLHLSIPYHNDVAYWNVTVHREKVNGEIELSIIAHKVSHDKNVYEMYSTNDEDRLIYINIVRNHVIEVIREFDEHFTTNLNAINFMCCIPGKTNMSGCRLTFRGTEHRTHWIGFTDLYFSECHTDTRKFWPFTYKFIMFRKPKENIDEIVVECESPSKKNVEFAMIDSGPSEDGEVPYGFNHVYSHKYIPVRDVIKNCPQSMKNLFVIGDITAFKEEHAYYFSHYHFIGESYGCTETRPYENEEIMCQQLKCQPHQIKRVMWNNLYDDYRINVSRADMFSVCAKSGKSTRLYLVDYTYYVKRDGKVAHVFVDNC